MVHWGAFGFLSNRGCPWTVKESSDVSHASYNIEDAKLCGLPKEVLFDSDAGMIPFRNGSDEEKSIAFRIAPIDGAQRAMKST